MFSSGGRNPVIRLKGKRAFLRNFVDGDAMHSSRVVACAAEPSAVSLRGDDCSVREDCQSRGTSPPNTPSADATRCIRHDVIATYPLDRIGVGAGFAFPRHSCVMSSALRSLVDTRRQRDIPHL